MKQSLGISAIVRILVYKPQQNSEVKMLVEPVEVKASEYFPLAFTFAEEFDKKNYDQIKKVLVEDSLKVASLMPKVDSGFYELVGEFSSLAIKEKEKIEIISWEIENYKVYQLTEEEANKCQ